MRAAAFWLSLWVFLTAGFTGYMLTARSFAWIGQGPDAPAEPPAQAVPVVPGVDLDAAKVRIPPALLQQAQRLTAKQLSCLQASISPDHLQAALQGRLTTQEMAAVAACLK